MKDLLLSSDTCKPSPPPPLLPGLTNKRLGRLTDALETLLKLHAIVRSNPPVVCQVAHLYQMMGDNEQAAEWYLQVLSLVPTDSHILERLGQIFDEIGDKQQAYQYYFDVSHIPFFYPG